MNESVITIKPWGRETQSANNGKRYHSVELSLRGLATQYQFKIWWMGLSPMCFLAKENSDILGLIKVGDTLKMKYYSNDSGYPPECLKTQIRDITRKDQGRFKGHFLVELQILENQEQFSFT